MENVVIGTYRLQRKLGEGGMGAVYLAEHVLLGRRAAVKVLLPALSAHEEVVNRFFNEARSTTSIADPGIVQVFDFGYHTDGSAYIVMEFLEGESLDARLRRLSRMSPSEALPLIRQIALSLSTVHERGIVHRDLKPENIFVVGDPAVTGGERTKILDFGIAKLAGEEPGRMKTRAGALMGTPVFMSPEQCRGAADVDHRADIYAMGCVLFCMLTGRPPFDWASMGEIIAAHLHQEAPAPSSLVAGLPPELDALVLRCLAKATADRFQSMRELIQAILAIESAGLGVVHVTPAQVAELSRRHAALTTLTSASGQTATSSPARRRRGARIAVIGAAVAALAIVAFVALGQRTAPAATQAVEHPVDAAAAPATVPAAVVIAVDAAVIDAAPIDAGSIDAGAPADKPRHHRRHGKEKDDDDDGPESSSPAHIDRGD